MAGSTLRSGGPAACTDVSIRKALEQATMSSRPSCPGVLRAQPRPRPVPVEMPEVQRSTWLAGLAIPNFAGAPKKCGINGEPRMPAFARARQKSLRIQIGSFPAPGVSGSCPTHRDSTISTTASARSNTPLSRGPEIYDEFKRDWSFYWEISGLGAAQCFAKLPTADIAFVRADRRRRARLLPRFPPIGRLRAGAA